MTTAPSHIRRLLRAGAGFAATAALLAGLPYALTRLIGWPLPHQLPTWSRLQALLITPLSDDTIVKILTCVVWLLWASFAVALIVEAAAAARGRAAPHLPVIAPVQALAATLISATILTTIPAPQASSHALSLQNALTSQAVATALPHPSHPEQPSGTAPAAAAARPQGPASANATSSSEPAARRPRVHRVVQGDNLWDIAARYLSDGERWREIYRLNAGKPQPDRRALTDPGLIYPGWVLLLPSPHRHPNTAPPCEPPTPAKPSPGHISSPSPAPRTPKRSPVPSANPSAQPAQHHQTHPTVVELPSGLIIGISLAGAISTAVVMTRMHRRRARQPADIPGTAPAEPKLTPALRRIRQAHFAHHDLNPADTQADTEVTGADTQQTDAQPPGPDGVSGTAANEVTEPEIPPKELASTETISVAARDDTEIPLQLDSAPGIGIDGPGAEGAVRAMMVTLLARRTKDHAEVIVTSTDAQHLLTLGADLANLPATPGLVITASLDESLTRLEAEIIHRRRLIDHAETTGLSSYRATYPDEYLPTVMLVAPAPRRFTGRLTATLTLGQTLGITGVLLGPWQSGPTCAVARGGQVTAATTTELQHLTGARMFQLTPTEATEMLAALAAADSTETTETPPQEPRKLDLPGTAARPDPADRPVRLSVLGPPTLQAGGQPIAKGIRHKAYELLAYLACHPDGATTEAILDALWPALSPRRAAVIFHTVTTNIRQSLRAATGETEAAFIARIRDRYRIDPAHIDVDLWRFQTALAHAAHADNDTTRRDALQSAASLWRGDLATGHDSEWADSWRETLRRDAADALTHLADLARNDSPDEAITLLERATTIDPYQEALYQRIIQIQASLRRPDAARRTYQLLESRLTEIDTEPDLTTVRLLHETLRSRE